MAQDKKQLEALLEFITKIAKEPGNEWFVEKLKTKFGSSVSEEILNKNKLLLDQIEKYLGLDFKLDSIDSIIDYSYISDAYVKDQLVSDNREMLRYRYGTRSHRIDFEEFCRYIILQAEMLMNYYYKNGFDNIEDAKDDILNNSGDIDIDNYKTIEKINFGIKLSAFCSKNKLFVELDILDVVRDIRNSQSHRNDSRRKDNIKTYKQKLISWKLPLKQDGTLNWFEAKNNPGIMDLYNKTKYSHEYRNYHQNIIIETKPFDNIILCLRNLSNSVRETV